VFPGESTLDSWKEILPGTLISKRCILRWTAKSVPVGEKVRLVLYKAWFLRSGMEPPIKYVPVSCY